jgi:hypothetical protein
VNGTTDNDPCLRWWQKATARNILWFAALAGVLAILLHESLFMGKGLVPTDALLHTQPWNQEVAPSNFILADQFLTFLPTQEFAHQQTHFALWNPKLCCGVPNLGAIQGALLFPIRLLFSPLGPFSASGPSAFVKLCLAGWFTMMYLRLVGVSRAGAFLAGLVFSLSGFMIVWLGHPHVNCAMWLPLLLYFVEKSFQGGRGNAFAAPALRAWVGFAVAFACMILGGHPPTAIHVTIVLGIYFLFRLLEHPRDEPLRRAGLMAGSLVAGLLLAAPQILPFLEYYRQSSCAASSASLERWSMHLTAASLIHFILPNFLGNPAAGFMDLPDLLGWHEKDSYGPENFNERNGYVGILPLFLAAIAIARRRCSLTRFFLFLVFGSMLVIFGVPPFAALARALPVLRDANETRLLLMVGFSVAVLAGLGWDEWSQMEARRRPLRVAIGFLVLVAGTLLCFGLVAGPNIHKLDAPHWAFLRRQLLILCGGMIVTFTLALWSARRAGWLPMLLCFGWTAIDLLSVALGYNPSVSRDRYYPMTPAIARLQQDDSIFRIFAGGHMLYPDIAEVFGLSDARGCDFMTVRRYEELITGHAGGFYFYRMASDFPSVFPLLNIKYILAGQTLPLNPLLFELVYSKEILIYRFKECRDRALLVFNYEVEPDPAVVRARVATKEFDPRQVLLLENQPVPAQPPVASLNLETNRSGSVRIVTYEPDDVRLEASLDSPGFLLLLDTYFPGWRATVNGAPAPIYQADYNFRAVRLPAGKSTVIFSYRPESFRIGIYLCALGILLLGGAWFVPSLWKSGAALPVANASES